MIFLVDPVYNPNFQSTISSSTKLAPGITCAKFLGGLGSRLQIERLSIDLHLMARQLYLQAEVMKKVQSSGLFTDHRLIVSEGLYKPAPGETCTTNSINDYKQTGRAVVYQLLDKKGNIDISKTFDLAVYIKDYCFFEKITLDYDTFDPNGIPSCQLVVLMPMANVNFDLTFTKNIETSFNGTLLSTNELVEVVF